MRLLEKYKELAEVLDGKPITGPMDISFLGQPFADQLSTISEM